MGLLVLRDTGDINLPSQWLLVGGLGLPGDLDLGSRDEVVRGGGGHLQDASVESFSGLGEVGVLVPRHHPSSPSEPDNRLSLQRALRTLTKESISPQQLLPSKLPEAVEKLVLVASVTDQDLLVLFDDHYVPDLLPLPVQLNCLASLSYPRVR